MEFIKFYLQNISLFIKQTNGVYKILSSKYFIIYFAPSFFFTHNFLYENYHKQKLNFTIRHICKQKDLIRFLFLKPSILLTIRYRYQMHLLIKEIFMQ